MRNKTADGELRYRDESFEDEELDWTKETLIEIRDMVLDIFEEVHEIALTMRTLSDPRLVYDKTRKDLLCQLIQYKLAHDIPDQDFFKVITMTRQEFKTLEDFGAKGVNVEKLHAMMNALECYYINSTSFYDVEKFFYTFGFHPILLCRIDALLLTHRCESVLEQHGIFYIGDLIKKTRAEMLRLPGFGHISCDEVREKLSKKHLAFKKDKKYESLWKADNFFEDRLEIERLRAAVPSTLYRW